MMGWRIGNRNARIETVDGHYAELESVKEIQYNTR